LRDLRGALAAFTRHGGADRGECLGARADDRRSQTCRRARPSSRFSGQIRFCRLSYAP